MKKVKWYQKSKYFRYVTQAIVFIFILQLVLKEIFKPTPESITISAEAYCPLGGLESIYQYIMTGKTLAHLHISNLIMLVIVVLITLVFRSGFCGWLCPFGTLQDIFRRLGERIGGVSLLKPLNRKYHRFLKDHSKMLQAIDMYARYLKYAILLWVVMGAFYYAVLVFRDYDPFVALIKIAELETFSGLIILGTVLVLSLFIDRPWCRYTCPLGAAIGLIGKLSPLRVVRNENACTNCNMCSKMCPMNINVASQKDVKSMDCNHCFECIDACPTKGAIDLKLILPNKKNQQYEINTVIKK